MTPFGTESEPELTLNPTLTDGHRIPIPSDATLEFVYHSPSRARIVAESVAREIGEIDDDRSKTTITREGDCVVFEIRARDLTALRAALNTWFSLVSVAEEITELAADVESAG